MKQTIDERAVAVKPRIPFEVVDDDELAAIDAAFVEISAIKRPSPYSNSCPPSLIHTSGSQSKRTIAEACTSWLAQCSNRQVRSLDRQIGSVFLLKDHSSSCQCCSSNRASQSRDARGSKYSVVQAETHVCTCSKENIPHDTPKAPNIASFTLTHSVLKESNLIGVGTLTASKDAMQGSGQDESLQDRAQEVTVPAVRDIEDLPDKNNASKIQKGDGDSSAPPEPKPRCLSVTDFTALEWCEKQVEFTKTLGKPKQTAAMKAGSARHAELEVEVLKRVEVEITSKEDSWAMRLINFITGARQLLSEGMTRELPVVGLIEGAWVIGIIDELKLCDRDGLHRPQLIDTKTRNKPTPPSAPQKQNGRMQLMVYKLLWDNLVTSGLPFDYFFEHFRLRPQHPLSSDIIVHAAEIFPDAQVENLQDVARMYSKECVLFPESHSLLLLRYEWQADRSLLGQDEFDIEREWLDLRIGWHLEFWHGLREPAYVPEDETWKCKYCAFAELCPAVQALSLGSEPKQLDQNPKSQKAQEPIAASEPKQLDKNPQSQKPKESIAASGILKYFKKDISKLGTVG